VEWFVRVHGVDPVSLSPVCLEYTAYDLLEALNLCKAAVNCGYMAELLMEYGN
jgi:hypothetical protein